MNSSPIASCSRRRALQCLSVTSLAAAWPGFIPTLYASDAPERKKLNFGFIALTDCSPLAIAHEKGLFKKYGLQSQPVKPANWAAVRDALIKGDVDCSHLLFGMPLASTMGLGGTKPTPMIIPWLLNRNGQAITLKSAWKGKVEGDPKALRPLIEEAKSKGKKATFAMTFPTGTHAIWLRYYLAAGGIHPDKDIDLITIPPPQMVQNMKVGKMDGFCVGEPWNARAIAEGVGFTSLTTQEIWPDHPEKVCAFTARFADENPKTVKAVLKALHEASTWLDDLSHRDELCSIIARDSYIKCSKEQILSRLLGQLDYGDGRHRQDDHYMIFNQRGCNYPRKSYALWYLTQLRRWGMIEAKPDYAQVASSVMRPEIYEEAMNELGIGSSPPNEQSWTLFDGSEFDPAGDLDAYAQAFPIHNLKGGS